MRRHAGQTARRTARGVLIDESNDLGGISRSVVRPTLVKPADKLDEPGGCVGDQLREWSDVDSTDSVERRGNGVPVERNFARRRGVEDAAKAE